MAKMTKFQIEALVAAINEELKTRKVEGYFFD